MLVVDFCASTKESRCLHLVSLQSMHGAERAQVDRYGAEWPGVNLSKWAGGASSLLIEELEFSLLLSAHMLWQSKGDLETIWEDESSGVESKSDNSSFASAGISFPQMANLVCVCVCGWVYMPNNQWFSLGGMIGVVLLVRLRNLGEISVLKGIHKSLSPSFSHFLCLLFSLITLWSWATEFELSHTRTCKDKEF